MGYTLGKNTYCLNLCKIIKIINMKKIALITGANKGLGFETAKQLGELNFTVVVTARTTEKLEATVKKLKELTIEVYGFKLDVTTREEIKGLVTFIESKFGRLDVLVNNAGVQLDLPAFMPSNTTESVSSEILKTTFDCNYFSVIELTQQLLPLLKNSTAGRIVNVSSIMGSLVLHADSTSPIYDIKLLAYNSSKTALNQFTIHLAHALKSTNVKVNAAHPGWVKTDLGGEYAPMEIKEGAKTIVDLCLIEENGSNGEFIHLGNKLPW